MNRPVCTFRTRRGELSKLLTGIVKEESCFNFLVRICTQDDTGPREVVLCVHSYGMLAVSKSAVLKK